MHKPKYLFDLNLFDSRKQQKEEKRMSNDFTECELTTIDVQSQPPVALVNASSRLPEDVRRFDFYQKKSAYPGNCIVKSADLMHVTRLI